MNDAPPEVRLTLGDRDVRLDWTDDQGQPQSRSLPVGLTLLAQMHRFSQPVNALALEAAIETIEDAVMPLASQMAVGAVLVVSNDTLPEGLLPALGISAANPSAAAFGLDALEAAFTELAALAQGRPQTQANIPATPDFAAALLVLREAMHHLRLPRARVTGA